VRSWKGFRKTWINGECSVWSCMQDVLSLKPTSLLILFSSSTPRDSCFKNNDRLPASPQTPFVSAGAAQNSIQSTPVTYIDMLRQASLASCPTSGADEAPVLIPMRRWCDLESSDADRWRSYLSLEGELHFTSPHLHHIRSKKSLDPGVEKLQWCW
jgi:hypothetical protein